MARFDGRGLAARLGEVTRGEIVRIAIELVVAWRGQDAAGNDRAAARPFEAAAVERLRQLEDKVEAILPPDVTAADRPPLPTAPAASAGADGDGFNPTGSGPEPIGPREGS